MNSIARFWESVGKSENQPELVPLHSDYPVPYFSIKRQINPNDKYNRIEIVIDPFIRYQLEALMKDIIYYLSPEKRAEVIVFNVEEVWVAADILVVLCEAYEQTPGVNVQGVRLWREATFDIWKQTDPELEETEYLYQDVSGVFDRLEAMSKKYPPDEW